jgi:hypothetical protein
MKNKDFVIFFGLFIILTSKLFSQNQIIVMQDPFPIQKFAPLQDNQSLLLFKCKRPIQLVLSSSGSYSQPSGPYSFHNDNTYWDFRLLVSSGDNNIKIQYGNDYIILPHTGAGELKSGKPYFYLVDISPSNRPPKVNTTINKVYKDTCIKNKITIRETLFDTTIEGIHYENILAQKKNFNNVLELSKSKIHNDDIIIIAKLNNDISDAKLHLLKLNNIIKEDSIKSDRSLSIVHKYYSQHNDDSIKHIVDCNTHNYDSIQLTNGKRRITCQIISSVIPGSDCFFKLKKSKSAWIAPAIGFWLPLANTFVLQKVANDNYNDYTSSQDLTQRDKYYKSYERCRTWSYISLGTAAAVWVVNVFWTAYAPNAVQKKATTLMKNVNLNFNYDLNVNRPVFCFSYKF